MDLIVNIDNTIIYFVFKMHLDIFFICCRVLMMGAPGVGKTALARQFMTSEYKGTYAESNTRKYRFIGIVSITSISI